MKQSMPRTHRSRTRLHTHVRMACKTATNQRASKEQGGSESKGGRESKRERAKERATSPRVCIYAKLSTHTHTHTHTNTDERTQTHNDDVAGVNKELHPGIATILLQQPRPKFCNIPSRLLVSKVWNSDSGGADARAIFPTHSLSPTLSPSLTRWGGRARSLSYTLSYSLA